MTDSNEDQRPPADVLPDALIREGHRRRISTVWIIPVVAALVAMGLAYRSYMAEGPEITISFESAEGLQVGKTTVRYREVVIGTVTQIDVSSDLSKAVVTAEMVHSARPYLVKGSRYWVVKPRFSAAGISGLGTLVSGSYIAMDPGDEAKKKVGGKEQKSETVFSFEGLELPPVDVTSPGLELVFKASALHGLSVGAPIYFRQVIVGQVRTHQLMTDSEGVEIHATIKQKYAHLVHENSRFWAASGLNVEASVTGGLEIDLESVAALIAGGVAFDTPGSPGAQVKDGAAFKLYPKYVDPADRPPDGPRFVLEADALGSLMVGEPVLYRGERVGRIIRQALRSDSRSVGILVAIDAQYASLVRTNSIFWDASGIDTDINLTGIHVHANSLETILIGAIGLATPDTKSPPAADGSVFALADGEPKHMDGWLPRIWVGKGKDPGDDGTIATPAMDPELVHHKKDEAGDPGSHHWFRHLF